MSEPEMREIDPRDTTDGETDMDRYRVAHLDEDWAIPCESGRRYTSGCGSKNLGEWVLWFVGCCSKGAPAAFVLCEPCKAKLLGDPAMWCNHCPTTFAPVSTAFRLVEPLNRLP